ncbi:hypothetical protein [Ferrovibrio terrae]|uniref:hypothetical protein n=1 Tax=Ferrovibrio terrae TaxID=2594003 RepID=UPI003137A65D
MGGKPKAPDTSAADRQAEELRVEKEKQKAANDASVRARKARRGGASAFRYADEAGVRSGDLAAMRFDPSGGGGKTIG